MKNRSLNVVGVVLVIAIAVGATWVWAQDGGTTYYACVNEPSGFSRIFMEETPCTEREIPITWNQTGPPGPKGDKGDQGPPGPHSVFEDVGTPFDGEPCGCHELAGDGFTDLVMHFKTQAVVHALQLAEFDGGDVVQLTVTGELLDGTQVAANDCILIVPRAKR